MQKSLQTKLLGLYSRRDSLAIRVDGNAGIQAVNTQQVFDEQERLYNETQHQLDEISKKNEKEQRIKLELHSMIALLCMRMGIATTDEDQLSVMLAKCDKMISENDFDAQSSQSKVQKDNAQNIRI
jgi:hypothetical protein